jgi:hypothetical protein
LAIARCSNAAAVQGNGQATQAGDAGALDGSDDWQHVLAKSVSLPGGEGGLGSFRDHTPLLLGQSGIEVQHERIGISTEFGHNERNALDHQASNEGNIARDSMAVIRYAERNGTRRPWLVQLMAQRTTKVAAVALANKTARMVWALMTGGERYREPVIA